ncbi:hypothetical protein [Sinosporangium album]|nr:hypothetical protein [Sinosporangium album]
MLRMLERADRRLGAAGELMLRLGHRKADAEDIASRSPRGGGRIDGLPPSRRS